MSAQKPPAPETRARQIARHIRTQIEAGELHDGQTLPTTRQLAAEWGASVNTVDTALQELGREGLVVSKPRSGRVVQAPDRGLPRARAVSPHVVLVGGYAGSGKTELGRILARMTGWAMLDKDTITRPVVEAALEMLGQPPSDREGETYQTVVRPAEYQALAAAMLENLECGTSVIATAPFLRELSSKAWIDRTAAACQALGAVVTIVWIQCDADSMRSYLRHRGAARDGWKLGHWDEYLAGVDLEFAPPADHLAVNNSVGARPLQEQAAELLRQITAPADA